jgi:hypothetical protein
VPGRVRDLVECLIDAAQARLSLAALAPPLPLRAAGGRMPA